MRYGFTTGSCAAAASKAAAYMLLSGREKKEIMIETPKGIAYTAKLEEIHREEDVVCCAVRKDGGDDPDITTGALIFARVWYAEQGAQEIMIDGGVGVGRVTKPGLDQPIGNAAINTVPRKMIEKEVREICSFFDYKGSLRVEISVPKGKELAERTFNPRLGIIGGISILGTSGIVEPMSSQAILDTIYVELRQKRAMKEQSVIISPGNYGQDFMKRTYGYDLDQSVKCSNFIGNTVDMAVEMGFERMLLVGHIGKLIKVAGGIMNTHSKEGDCRMELLAAYAVEAFVDPEVIRQMMKCVTTEEAVKLLKKSGKLEVIMQQIVEKICYYLEKRGNSKLSVDCIMYTNELGELGKSKGARSWFIL